MTVVYEPSRSLSAKVSRRLTPYLARRILRFKPERPVVSFTFDDCPVSAIDNGVMPLAEKGWKSTIYVAGSLLSTINHHGRQISPDDVVKLHASGHEIGGHTFSHVDAQSLSEAGFLDDVQRNQDFLGELGLPPSQTFAYPYGQTQAGLKASLALKFEGLRGIQPGVHRSHVDLNQIKSIALFSGSRLQTALGTIARLKDKPAWVTFFTHDIRHNHSDWGCSPGEMQEIIQAVEDVGATVLPVSQAITTLRGSHD